MLVFPRTPLSGDQIPVLHKEGLTHGFLVLSTLDGKKLADGELAQTADGNRISSHLTFRFADGSFYEDRAEFLQEKTFRLLSDHVVQKGPSFKPAEISIDVPKGQVTGNFKDDHGQEKQLNAHLEMPPDVSNGLLFTLVKDIKPSTPQTTVSFLASTPKPRIVKLVIVPAGEKSVSIGKIRHNAVVYQMKVQIGGITGMLAKLTGKQPPDTRIWIMQGEAPVFIKSEGPLYEGGPIWRIELGKSKTEP